MIADERDALPEGCRHRSVPQQGSAGVYHEIDALDVSEPMSGARGVGRAMQSLDSMRWGGRFQRGPEKRRAILPSYR